MLLKTCKTLFVATVLIMAIICDSNINSAFGYSKSRHKGIIDKDKCRHKGMTDRSEWKKSSKKPYSRRLIAQEEAAVGGGGMAGDVGKGGTAGDVGGGGVVEDVGGGGMAGDGGGAGVAGDVGGAGMAPDVGGGGMTDIEGDEDIPIGERQAPQKSEIEGSVKLPMYAAAEYAMGQYLVDIEIGTPPKKLRMVADTGSDLTWVKCNNGDGKSNFKQQRVFDARSSNSFKSISCGTSPLCQEDFRMLSSLDLCPTIDAPCYYNYSYGDEGLATYGKFSQDTITLPTTTGTPVALKNMLIGCSNSITGNAKFNEAEGILGLGMHPYSFAIHGVAKFGGTFSYCLVDHLSPHNVTNYLIFGDQREKCPTQEFMRYTALHVSQDSAFYWIYIKGISIGKNMLDISPVVWDTAKDNGGTILDSGTSATYWVEPAYTAIMDVLVKTLEKEYPKLPDWKGDGVSDFEYCFEANATEFEKFKVPRFEIHFKDGARFKPHVKSYIIDDSVDIKCIGFLVAPGGVNIVGNILQQNYLWEFDVYHETMGFAASTCD